MKTKTVQTQIVETRRASSLAVALITFTLLLTPYHSFSQSTNPELISSSGDEFTTGSGSVAWSIGECMTETYSPTGSILTQGLHQDSYNIVVLLENKDINFNISVYPNPAIDYIWLEAITKKDTNLDYQIIDLTGKVLCSEKINSDITQINLTDYPNSLYFVKIIENNQRVVQSYKITKNK